MIQTLDGIDFIMQEAFDFSFLKQYGQVFKVFDQQDSGCICFGMHNGEERFFIKFAGARTAYTKHTPTSAILCLQQACKIYDELRHPNLVSLIKCENVGNGYAAIFAWTDAECMGKQYASRPKFFQLPISDRIAIFEAILTFHLFVADRGYVAIDFYDGSILYNFTTRQTFICDIDYYARLPYINTIGRMWGSSRFMSPEEYEMGAVIDEVSNVFLMGATAFNLLGDPLERLLTKWQADPALYKIASKAASHDRLVRYSTIQAFTDEWHAVLKNSTTY